MHRAGVTGRLLPALLFAVAACQVATASAQAAFRLTSVEGLDPRGVQLQPVTYRGKQGIRVVENAMGNAAAVVLHPDANFANGQWNWADRVATLVVRATGEASASDRQFVLLVIETFAAAALLLAAIGLYGVISGSVAERHRETGIRTALGATPRNVVGKVVGGALGLALVGAGIGLAGAAAATRLIASMLFGVSALDPLTYGSVVALLPGVAVLVAWASAGRAARVDPVLALRAE